MHRPWINTKGLPSTSRRQSTVIALDLESDKRQLSFWGAGPKSMFFQYISELIIQLSYCKKGVVTNYRKGLKK